MIALLALPWLTWLIIAPVFAAAMVTPSPDATALKRPRTSLVVIGVFVAGMTAGLPAVIANPAGNRIAELVGYGLPGVAAFVSAHVVRSLIRDERRTRIISITAFVVALLVMLATWWALMFFAIGRGGVAP